jgi:hypothetical protein
MREREREKKRAEREKEMKSVETRESKEGDGLSSHAK